MFVYNGKNWRKCEHETEYVYSSKWNFGKVIGKCGRKMNGLRVQFENGMTCELSYHYHHDKCHTLSYIEPYEMSAVDYLKKRGVKYLVHFTQVPTLRKIMKEGLRPLPYQSEPSEGTDDARYDGNQDAICLSVTFPNYQMFYNKRNSKNEYKYAVLEIDVDALNSIKPECVGYYADNAARRELSRVPFSCYCTLDAAMKMFAEETDENNINIRVHNQLPMNYTTHPQAEIQVKGIIDKRYIRKIYFDCDMDESCIETEEIRKLVVWDHFVFSYRRDWQYWKKEK